VRWLAGGKELLASGSEAGHGTRDYLINVGNGESKAITPEGVVGVEPSPDGRSVAVATSEGNWGIWLLDGGTLHTIPRLDSNYHVGGWSADGGSVFAFPTRQSGKTENMYRVNVLTGKMELVKTFGQDLPIATCRRCRRCMWFGD
jgi:hypothetical protein